MQDISVDSIFIGKTRNFTEINLSLYRMPFYPCFSSVVLFNSLASLENFHFKKLKVIILVSTCAIEKLKIFKMSAFYHQLFFITQVLHKYISDYFVHSRIYYKIILKIRIVIYYCSTFLQYSFCFKPSSLFFSLIHFSVDYDTYFQMKINDVTTPISIEPPSI